MSTWKDCFSGLEDTNCKNLLNSSAIFYNKSCIAVEEFCASFKYYRYNDTHCFINDTIVAFGDIYNRTLSSEEYFR